MKGDVMEVNEDNFLDFTLADVEDAVAVVKHDFDAEAALNLIRYFHYRFRDGGLFDSVQLRPIERAFIEYVEYAFARIVEQGKSPQVAFGLNLGRGEYPRPDTTIRDVEICAYMILLMRNNWKWQDAKGEAANIFFPDGKGDKAVEKAYAEYKNELCQMKDDTLKDLLPNGAQVNHTPAINPVYDGLEK